MKKPRTGWGLMLLLLVVAVGGVWMLVFHFNRLEDSGSKRQEEIASELPAPESHKADKLALLIGINDYQNVRDLEGSLNDVEAMKGLLIQSFGFDPGQIRVLRDGEATREGILRAIREQLIDRARRDAVVVLHYSGHGSRRKDDSGDEPDGWDETLVPYDSGRDPYPNLDISDDELNMILAELGAKTPYATLIFDSCFSGSIVRGSALARTIESDERPPVPGASATPHSQRGLGEGASGFRPGDARYALITGAADQETANELSVGGRNFGALTWHLVEQIQQMGAAATYRDVMESVSARVSIRYPSQHPQLSGGGADRLVFDTQSQAPEPYILVSPVENRKVRLEAGQVHGLARHSVFDVYPPGVSPFDAGKPPVARIEITQVGVTVSEGRVLKGNVKHPASRAIAKQRHYKDFQFKVYLQDAADSPLLGEIRQELTLYGHIREVPRQEGYDLLLREKKGVIFTEGAASFEVSPRVSVSEPEAVGRVVDQVIHWAKWHGLLSIENRHGKHLFDVDIETETQSHLGESRHSDMFRSLLGGEACTIRITNRSGQNLYWAVLNLSGDGSVTLLYPEAGEAEFLAPGESWEAQFEAFLPAGRASIRDFVKVFAVTEPSDFRFLEQGPTRDLNALNPLEQLLCNAAFGTSRGLRELKVEEWSTASRILEIKKE